ncbi:unnamed protein product [Moneuplotes crassus]|uniref:Uncharacterized protein n=1 Tax=Euplotes crassus TaxID=5936 RepID=A0AAD1X914_EUPCR|nr:unnamed protein product [Moneuplotes crassus]
MLKSIENEEKVMTFPQEVQSKIDAMMRALDVFSSFNENSCQEAAQKLAEEQKEQIVVIKNIFDGMAKEGSSAEFTSLKQQMESLQDSIGQEPLFIKFVLDRFWSQMNSTPTQHETAPTSHSEAPSQDLAACLSQIDKLNEELKQRDACIEQLENTNQELETTVEELKAQVAGGSQENALAASYAESGVGGEQAEEEVIMSYAEMIRLYSEILNYDAQFDETTMLTLPLAKPHRLELLEAFHQRLPPIATLQIQSIPTRKKKKIVKTFMRNHFPSSLKELEFNYMSKLMPITPFMDELAIVGQRVTESMSLANFEINQQELATILYYNKHRVKLALNDCKLDLSSAPNFGEYLDGCTLNTLDLMDTGNAGHGNWKANPHEFENLLAGLCYCEDFRVNLKRLGVLDCGLNKQEICYYMEMYGFGHVEVMTCML